MQEAFGGLPRPLTLGGIRVRRFIDLQVRLPKALGEAEELARHLRKLGFKAVALTVLSPREAEDFSEVEKVFERFGLDAALRLNLTPQNPRRLLEELRRLRGRFEIIGVWCEEKQVARQAAKDHRVDCLLFPPRQLKLFDEAEAELASHSEAALELPLSVLLGLPLERWPAYLAEASRAVKTALDYEIPVVCSSGALNLYELRAPRDLAALAETLYGLPKGQGLKAVSTHPSAILQRNRSKLSSNFVEVGVRVVRRPESW
ncbi:MAG: RNase P subunit p30 family protein [Candidatus Hecatellaceae archaeon]